MAHTRTPDGCLEPSRHCVGHVWEGMSSARGFNRVVRDGGTRCDGIQPLTICTRAINLAVQ